MARGTSRTAGPLKRDGLSCSHTQRHTFIGLKLMAIERFIVRLRGPEVSWFDNGNNFIGAEKELRLLQQPATDMKLSHSLALLMRNPVLN